MARDERLRSLMRLSGWAVLQHMGIGILLGATLVLGNRVEGGVVAYQFAFVLFLAPYAIMAHPVQTAIQPELSLDAERHDDPAFATGVRWAADSMALLVVPVSAAFIALAVPAMRAITVDSANHNVDLLAAAIASLGIGLFPYSVFLLFARALYARGDSRTPAIVALATALIGVACMTAISYTTHGTGRVLALGYGHSLAYLLGAVVLGFILYRRLHASVFPSALPLALIVSAVLGGAAWGLFEVLGPMKRIPTIALLVAVGVVGAAIYIGVIRLVRRQGMPTLRPSASAPASVPAPASAEPGSSNQGGNEKPTDAS
jgi:putative peptidoglycan lipid II flippase